MRILLVEDDILFREIINNILNKQGHLTTLASDGNEAISKMQFTQFDLLITDILMPDKEGLELIQEVKEINPAMKIIAISSGGQAGYTSFLKIAETFGADATLEKPFSPADLLAKIDEFTETSKRECIG